MKSFVPVKIDVGHGKSFIWTKTVMRCLQLAEFLPQKKTSPSGTAYRRRISAMISVKDVGSINLDILRE